MKKFVVLFVVAALTCFGSVAYAVDVSVSGSIDIRSRDFKDLTLNKSLHELSGGEFAGSAGGTDSSNPPYGTVKGIPPNGTEVRDTQERIRVNVDAKAGNDVKGRISIENDWDSWGRFEEPQGDGTTATVDHRGTKAQLDVREAWVSFNLPGVPVNVTGGHQLLQLGQGWWFRSMKYGSDAWVVANVTGNNTAAFVDVKAYEGNTFNTDDVDFYVLLDVYKIDDKNVVGIDLTNVHDRQATLTNINSNLAFLFTSAGKAFANPFRSNMLNNIGLNYTGQLGPVNLKAELDFQTGYLNGIEKDSDIAFRGNQVILQGKVAVMEPLSINFTAARGSGNKDGDNNFTQVVTALDNDQHYTLLYEYKVKTAATVNVPGGPQNLAQTNTGFANTTALNVGAQYAVLPSLGVGADFWWLRATEKVGINGGPIDYNLGYEVDVNINWKLYDNLTWNWVLGYFKPGKAYDFPTTDIPNGPVYKADAATGIQGVLSFKF